MNAPDSIATKAKAKFSWDDPLLLSDQLTEEERMVRDAAHSYAHDKLMPRVTEAFRHEKSDPAIFREMGALGLLGATLPSEYGGAVQLRLLRADRARIERVDSGRSMTFEKARLSCPDLHV